jgi:peptide deformylase
MSLNIIKYGSPILRAKSIEVNEGDPVNEDVAVLFDILEKSNGVGLSGVQIGILKRVFIIDTTRTKEDNPEMTQIKKAYINPAILSKSDKLIWFNEGCLSIPEIYEEVERPEKITVKYQNIMFHTIEEEINGIEARIFQHEYDHLNGILFIDRLSPLRKVLLAGKLKKIKKR